MKAYECMVLLEPTMLEEDVEKFISKAEETIQKSGNVLENVERLGKRRLAYEIKKFQDAYYVIFKYKANNQFNSEFNRFLRLSNGVMRFMIITLPEEKKNKKAAFVAA